MSDETPSQCVCMPFPVVNSYGCGCGCLGDFSGVLDIGYVLRIVGILYGVLPLLRSGLGQAGRGTPKWHGMGLVCMHARMRRAQG